mgnify:CR=1 FL=1
MKTVKEVRAQEQSCFISMNSSIVNGKVVKSNFKEDKFSNNEDQYGVKEDKFNRNEDKYGVKEDKFNSDADKYEVKEDKFSDHDSEYGVKEDKSSMNDQTDDEEFFADLYSEPRDKTIYNLGDLKFEWIEEDDVSYTVRVCENFHIKTNIQKVRASMDRLLEDKS